VSIGGQAVGENLTDLLGPYLESGDEIKFVVERDGKRATVVVKPVAR
jgi:hypothetical protein